MERAQSQPVVWMIAPTFAPATGGTPVFVRWLSRALLRRGWRVEVVTRRHGSGLPVDLPAREEVDGIPVLRISGYGSGRGKASSISYALGVLWHLLRQRQPGIFQALDLGAPAWIAVGARCLLGGRSVLRLCIGSAIYARRMTSRLGRWLVWAQLRLVDQVVVLNNDLEGLVRGLGAHHTHMVRIANGVDTGYYRPPSTHEQNRCRAELGLARDRTVVLCVARLVYVKRVDLLVRAWALIPEETRSALYLVVAGDGQGRGALQQAIDVLDLSDSVRLDGTQCAVRDYYWAADLFVLPSRSEGMSNALLEAMACGLPSIASDVEGNVDLLDEGETGWLFRAGDPAALARALDSVAGAPGQWTAMGQCARQAILEDYDLATIGQQYHALYQRLLAMSQLAQSLAPSSDG